MSIISTQCPTGPSKSRECLAFFGVEYQIYVWLAVVSLLMEFGMYFLYLKIKRIEAKRIGIKGLIISLIIFLVVSIFNIWWKSQRIY